MLSTSFKKLPKKFGQRLKLLREASGKSQREFAELCGWTSQARVAHYEVHIREPSWNDVETMARVLGVPPAALWPGPDGDLIPVHRVPVVEWRELLMNKARISRVADVFWHVPVGPNAKWTTVPKDYPPFQSGDILLIDVAAKLKVDDYVLVSANGKNSIATLTRKRPPRQFNTLGPKPRLLTESGSSIQVIGKIISRVQNFL